MMKDRLLIADFRASIFMPKIPYNNETLQQLLPLFPGFVPSIIQPAIEISGNQPPQFVGTASSTWELVSSDNKIHVVFADGKIDVLIHTKTSYTKETIAMLSKQSEEYFKIIMDKFGNMSSRLAIAPTLSVENIDERNLNIFISSQFNKKSYKDGVINNGSFTNVFRVNENINGESFLCNYNIKVKTVNELQAERNTIRIINSLISEIDINTFPNPQYRFNVNHISDFFDRAHELTEPFVDFYFT